MARLWVGAALIVSVLVLALVPDKAAPPLLPFEVPPQYEDRITELDRIAVETAYSQQVIHLFLTWMKDESGQPERVTRGVRQAQRAYVESMKLIEARKPAK